MTAYMTLKDAAHCLGRSQAWIYAYCQEYNIPLFNHSQQFSINHLGAKRLFQFQFRPQIITFQILKGGTGKTSLVFEFAVRAQMYGAKVLCIDMDSQGNLSQAFNQNAEESPVMIDCLTEGYSILDAIQPIEEGLDLLPSRIENALLDEALRLQKKPLDRVYREIFQELKQHYDLIILDCPPSLGQSVVASALAADLLVSPTTPDKFSLAGLDLSYRSMEELKVTFSKELPHKIILNKFEPKDLRSQEVWKWLKEHPHYQKHLVNHPIRYSETFPNAGLAGESIFENTDPSIAKEYEIAREDVNCLTLELLGIPRRSQFLFDQVEGLGQEALQEDLNDTSVEFSNS